MEKIVEKFYCKYEYLVYSYCKNLKNLEKCGYEKDDLLQELKMRLFMGIQAYGRKYKVYLETGLMKPIPIEYYLRTLLKNRIKDFYQMFEKYKRMNTNIMIGEDVDLGYRSDLERGININFDEKKLMVNDVDILSDLDVFEKNCVCLYFKGYSINNIQKLVKNKKFKNCENFKVWFQKYLKNLQSNTLLRESEQNHIFERYSYSDVD